MWTSAFPKSRRQIKGISCPCLFPFFSMITVTFFLAWLCSLWIMRYGEMEVKWVQGSWELFLWIRVFFFFFFFCLFVIFYGQKLVLSTWDCPSSPLPPHCTKPQMAGMCAICFFLVDLCLHKAWLRTVLSSTQYAYVLCIKPTVFHHQWVLTGHFGAGSMV